MSLVSQTSPGRRAPWLRRGVLVPALVAAGVVAAAVSPFGVFIAREVARADPHGPDLAVFAALSPVVKIHLLAALGALGLGAALMLVRKGRTFHRAAGWVWVCLASTVAGSSIFITDLNNGSWSLIHLFTGWVLLALPLAVLAAKRHNIGAHRKAMTGLFYGGFAFNLILTFIPGRAMWNLFLG